MSERSGSSAVGRMMLWTCVCVWAGTAASACYQRDWPTVVITCLLAVGAVGVSLIAALVSMLAEREAADKNRERSIQERRKNRGE